MHFSSRYWRSAYVSAALAVCIRANGLRADPAAPDDHFLRDYAETRGFMLGRPVNATPTPDGKTVLFLRAKSGREPSQELYAFDVASGQTRRLLAPEDALKGASEKLSPEEKARRERQRISVGGFTAFSISKDSALVLLSLSGKLYVLGLADGSVRELATGEGTIVDPKFSPDGKNVAYVRGYDVYVFDLATGKERAVTTGGTETVSHGLAEFVAQEEMARFSGYWWSPDSRSIAYQESDASRVESWYVADPAQPGNPPERVFYPRPGKENVSVRLGVVSVDGDGASPKWLEWDRTHYPYLGKVTWTEHGPLTLTVLSRDQTDLALLKVEPETGGTSTLLTEHDDAWVNLPEDVPIWLSEQDGDGFLWASERRGERELEWHTPDGQLQDEGYTFSQGLRSVVGIANGQACYIRNGVISPISTDLGFTIIDRRNSPQPKRKQKQLDRDAIPTPREHAPKLIQFREDGLSSINFGDSKTIFAVTEQTPTKMPHTSVVRVKDHEIARVDTDLIMGELPSVAIEPPSAPVLTFEKNAKPILLSPGNRAAEAWPPYGQGFLTALIHPRDFDKDTKRKYPVIVDVYGGPSHQQVVASMRSYLLDQWLADQGFIVVAIDGRGTPGRGHDWERAIDGHFGSVPLDDQVAALKLLGAQHPEMDMDRVGITGWSFGGYMAALAVLRRPDVFKAAVAGAPVTDWMDYDTCYTERYLGVPGAGRWPDAYKEGSLLTYADHLTRPLLLIHGTADDNVYFRHSLNLINALFHAGQPVDFLPLSSFTHMVPDPVVRSRLEERIVQYFQTHLGHPEPGATVSPATGP